MKMKKITGILALLGAGLLSSPVAHATIVPLYRFLNSTDHLYTTNYGEGVGAGYQYEGVQCFVDDSPDAGTVPLYRYFFPGRSHFYTTSWGELGGGGGGYNYEGVQCYVWPSPTQGLEPFYRYRSLIEGGVHFYTTNPTAERLGSASWQLVPNPLYDPFEDPDGTGVDIFGNPAEISVIVQSNYYALEGIQCYVLKNGGDGDILTALAGEGPAADAIDVTGTNGGSGGSGGSGGFVPSNC